MLECGKFSLNAPLHDAIIGLVGEKDIPLRITGEALGEAEVTCEFFEFGAWFDTFLPELPPSLLEPAIVRDSRDGQIAHLHGLNLSRAHCWRVIVDSLPPDDRRLETISNAISRHAEAALPQVVGGHYMVEHWLAAYALLLLT